MLYLIPCVQLYSVPFSFLVLIALCPALLATQSLRSPSCLCGLLPPSVLDRPFIPYRNAFFTSLSLWSLCLKFRWDTLPGCWWSHQHFGTDRYTGGTWLRHLHSLPSWIHVYICILYKQRIRYSSLKSVDDNQAWLCQIWLPKNHLSLLVKEQINLVGIGKYKQNDPPQHIVVLKSLFREE